MNNEKVIDMLEIAFKEMESKIERLKKNQKTYVISNGDSIDIEEGHGELQIKIDFLEERMFELDELIDKLKKNAE